MVNPLSLWSASCCRSGVIWLYSGKATENGAFASLGVSRSLFHSKGTRFSATKTTVKATLGSSWSKFQENEAFVEDSSGKTDEYLAKKNPESNWRNLSEAGFGRSREDSSSWTANEDEERAKSGRFQRNRWDKKFKETKMGNDRNSKREYQRRENWGAKVGKDPSESSVPKMIGEAVYGLGPVLAALSIQRRQFNALYVQEGIEMSGNNKKKDKKGFERVMKMAEIVGLTVKATSKHDLNMIVDNRPHQGLVLDASPLEMVRITELEREEDSNSLWVALDEVTDPQNLGAIIRSSYFFGVAGVVVCAKNSAPLSGVVSKASAGSLELMELRYCRNMMQFLVASAENGWRVVGGSVSSKAVSLDEISSGEPTILVLGSEGSGLRTLVERSCTHLVRIPSNTIPIEEHSDETERESGSFTAVESLNVSVAAGVLLHRLSRRSNQ